MNSINKNNVVSYSLAFLLLGALINSGYFFTVMLKLSIGQWLAFNACSIAIIVYIVCFLLFQLLKKDYLMVVPLLPLYYYGTMGLFIMPWNSTNMFAQITHILISINVLWVLYILLKGQKFESIGKGSLIGIFIFVPLFAYIQSYTQLHMNEFIKALQSV